MYVRIINLSYYLYLLTLGTYLGVLQCVYYAECRQENRATSLTVTQERPRELFGRKKKSTSQHQGTSRYITYTVITFKTHLAPTTMVLASLRGNYVNCTAYIKPIICQPHQFWALKRKILSAESQLEHITTKLPRSSSSNIILCPTHIDGTPDIVTTFDAALS